MSRRQNKRATVRDTTAFCRALRRAGTHVRVMKAARRYKREQLATGHVDEREALERLRTFFADVRDAYEAAYQGVRHGCVLRTPPGASATCFSFEA